MLFSNFGIWNFDNLIFLYFENINFWIYMYVILVEQAFVFLVCVCGGGGGGLNLLCQKRRTSCTLGTELACFKYCGEEEQHVFIVLYIQPDKIYKEYKNECLRVESTHTQLEDKCIS